mmetsp:Transcript_21877/g.85746  ORF Transcript_21877/g.85746 Transcript_21877/m.85746 type:complete len:245 (+) Transcript_21877:332-1066(+)|eukprot:CAMPEP_0114625740 /NCGR_PEP_ID=MMETSP0168-20121206/11422_1 /TAXON_ID=95228 ORGANISM="Vannella sp., Strain DIVA3 517/6/12" /NCGR_SAMPLE_ID=MMETSP0168 /ASSEMBLY_ACC=CAM_ASM_000044 /LENGTH=244 /DNA_ID=CAMNT_0001837023 /DNA_START=50 /DNA_END=784 /DNA_ORIENTATION=-
MTTAHRPTWAPAIASKDQGGNRKHVASQQFSARDLPGHTKLKLRQPGQNTEEEIAQRDLKAELLEREKEAKRKRRREEFGEGDEDFEETKLLTAGDGGGPVKRKRLKEEEASQLIDFGLDADDAESDSSSSDEESDDSSDDSDDSDDEQDEIQRELARMKAERAAARARQEQEQQAEQRANEEDTILSDNPLLADEGDFSLSKKWYDDAVFKNQTRDEPKPVKRFINDTTRNDFHRKFLNKYVK